MGGGDLRMVRESVTVNPMLNSLDSLCLDGFTACVPSF